MVQNVTQNINFCVTIPKYKYLHFLSFFMSYNNIPGDMDMEIHKTQGYSYHCDPGSCKNQQFQKRCLNYFRLFLTVFLFYYFA